MTGQAMTETIGDLWEALGSLDEMESAQLLTRLFTIYEEQLAKNPEDDEAKRFFDNLRRSYELVSECNLNRR